ncbi:hypothetical protein BRARA_E02866 [Brassica rapa]|uniref:Leucine-rich repeat-containing N-terminal plant-type domain-containing protein n=1 Tax=Brassica campestris TaxID=3711 RepID=A0A397ZMZ7_BRACM|nr:hypothetical protein BRARA_E02866 [Brassica rapa]
MKLLLCLSMLFISSLPPSYSCNSKEENTLLQIKKHFNNPDLLSTWSPATDCCTSWTGIECTNGRVTLLSMSKDKKLVGHIPDQIGDLLELQSLEMSYLNLTGTIPRTITKLKHLDLIFLTWNRLSGPIPEYISELKSVTFLDISFNKFTGPIPGWLTQMPNLQTFQADNNSLTGPIPNSFGSFVGNVPNLFLPYNKLSVKFGKSMALLDLSHNRIFGKLPRELTELHLQRFNISYNRLCGKIPRGGKLQTFKSYEFAHNRCLCGSPLKKAC